MIDGSENPSSSRLFECLSSHNTENRSNDGPTPSTVIDFWRMVWEQNSPIIVMLTKPNENGKVKCEQYWPDGEPMTYGQITVTPEEKEELADFEIRKFRLQKNSQPQFAPRIVTHFFFTSWPDHDVPDYATGLLELWKRVKKKQLGDDRGPMIVHCSAGVGRTGAFIVIDAMMQQIESDGEIDVFIYVTKLRAQRNMMVQRPTQYVFIHHAILEALTFGNTEIDVQNLRAELTKLKQRNHQKNSDGLEDQFELLNGVVEDDSFDFTTAVQPRNTKKNRYTNILPFERTRVTLSTIPGKDDATYINASYLEGYQEKVAYIATQAPLEDTVKDFWRMIWDTENSYIIVMLCKLDEPSKLPLVQYWPSKGSVKYGSLLVDTRSQVVQKEMTIRELVLQIPRIQPSASQPVSQSASQPVSQSASQPVSQSASQPVSQSASQPVSQSASQPVSQSASQPVSQSASQPVSQSASQPVSQSASQPVSQSASQPVSQSASQPVSQSASQPVFNIEFNGRLLSFVFHIDW
ncbi:hypothetical protein QZH41_002644 [Actinostola sp. cb2023]|nr:hypothetical protein QZH41_002644 [Actinostola sp. cb2023]